MYLLYHSFSKMYSEQRKTLRIFEKMSAMTTVFVMIGLPCAENNR